MSTARDATSIAATKAMISVTEVQDSARTKVVSGASEEVAAPVMRTWKLMLNSSMLLRSTKQTDRTELIEVSLPKITNFTN